MTPLFFSSLMACDKDAGMLIWLPRPPSAFQCDDQERRANWWASRFVGKPALHGVRLDGYRSGNIDGKGYFAHRVIWTMVTGAWPDWEIDHINGDRADNRWVNLRAASRSQNSMNRASRRGASLFTGVTARHGRWEARIGLHRKRIHIGSFASEAEAARAYDAAALKLHGEFARLNFPQGVAP
jgi:hypothetical protein